MFELNLSIEARKDFCNVGSAQLLLVTNVGHIGKCRGRFIKLPLISACLAEITESVEVISTFYLAESKSANPAQPKFTKILMLPLESQLTAARKQELNQGDHFICHFRTALQHQCAKHI